MSHNPRLNHTHPDGNTEHFSYDSNGNLLTRTVPTPATHTFAYNGANLRVRNTSPLNRATTYTYDRSKNITAITKPSGKEIAYTYSDGRLEKTTTPEDTIVPKASPTQEKQRVIRMTMTAYSYQAETTPSQEMHKTATSPG